MALSDGLLAYWKFDESSGDAEDSVGSLDLTNNNSVSYSSGKINNGADLERGSSQYFSITNAAAGSTFDLSAMSISVWVKFESYASGTREPFFTSWASNAGIIFYKDDSDILLLALGNGSSTTFDSVTWTPSSGVWYHIVLTFDSGEIKFYVDGAQQGTTQSSTFNSIPSTNNDYNIGKRTDTGHYLDGMLDEMGIWNRAITLSEVEELYNSGDGNQYPFSPVVGYIISGTVTLDSTPVEGATVRCVRQSDNVALDDETTDSNGDYIFSSLDSEELYHVAVEYESGETKYNALSLWDVSPAEGS